MSKFIKVRDVNSKGEWRTVICERTGNQYNPIPQYADVAESKYYIQALDTKGKEKPLQVISPINGVREVVWQADKLPH